MEGDVFSFRTRFSNTILEVMLEKGWKQAEDDEYNFAWLEKFEVPLVYKRRAASLNSRNFFVNHFYTHYQITRKDLLAANINKALRFLQKMCPALLDYFYLIPATFIIPYDFSLFYYQQASSRQYIVKPANLAYGKGIFIAEFQEIYAWYKKDYPLICQQAKELDDYNEDGPRCGHQLYLVYEYINRPLLVNGHKFDMRIYVLVRAFQPLDVWICRHGFARFALTRYAENGDRTGYLTNIAIQKHVEGYHKELDGAKWGIEQLFYYLLIFNDESAVKQAFFRVEKLIVRMMQIAAPLMTQSKCSFEIYGFDIMLDEDLRPFLLEVNASPSLSADTHEDLVTKKCMLHDALSLVVQKCEDGPIYGCWHQVMNAKRMIQFSAEFAQQGLAACLAALDEGMVSSGTFLGCAVQRAEHLL